MEETDQDLVARVRAGDSDAFRGLVRRYTRSLFRVAFRMTGDEACAEDVVQETFLRAFRQLDQYESRSAFGTWIHRIAVNYCYDLHRRERTVAADGPEPVSLAPSPFRLAQATEVRTALSEALRRLTVQERTAFVLRHYEEWSVPGIAAALGISETATKNSIFRAVRKVRERLEGRF